MFALCALATCTLATAQNEKKNGLVPLTERVNVQADSARIHQVIDGCWVAVGTPKEHAIQRDYTVLFQGQPSYRFELKEDDNTLSGYAKGKRKEGRSFPIVMPQLQILRMRLLVLLRRLRS